ncbi:MAG: hypothetical protein HY897_09475 [Deltaproteobacteria bacterium]|nr:hypothetical protein [Deltaproteobacteria bacterium]
MSKCVYCHEKKGKRNCPALEGTICSLCCGTHRKKTIQCPEGCPFLAQAAKEEIATHDSLTRVTDKLDRFMLTTKAVQTEMAKVAFLGDARDPEEWEAGPCHDYCFLGRVDENGERLVDIFLRERGAELRPDELAALKALQNAWFSLFEVQEVKRDEGLDLRSLISNEAVFVRERLATHQIVKHDILLGWVVLLGDHSEITGGCALVPRVHGEQVLDIMHDVLMQDEGPRQLLTLGKNQKMILPAFQALRAAYRNVRLPRFTNTDGHKLVFSTAGYDVLDEAAVHEGLDSHPSVRQQEENEEETVYGWRDAEAREGFGGQPISLGTITIKKGHLFLETNSRERLERGKVLLAELLGGAAKHIGDGFKDGNKMAADHMAENAGLEEFEDDDDPMDDDGIPPEEKSEFISEFFQDHLKRWVDMKIPDLGGRTPREAVKTNDGRLRVLEMLKDQENDVLRHPYSPQVDFTEVYLTLGLKR